MIARPRLTIVTAGQIDHGKSTVLGRLLADAGGIPRAKMEAAQAREGFEFAHLLDSLKDEQEKGMPIDAARVYLKGANRDYQFVDAPGHFEFLRNMVTGAARADGALLVVDAESGPAENTRRHAALLSLLGITRCTVIVNKMDRVAFEEACFLRREHEMKTLLSSQNLTCSSVLPVSGIEGDNVVEKSDRMKWFGGLTLFETLEAMPSVDIQADRAFRMSVQDVFEGCVLGSVESGRLRIGDEIGFAPSMRTARVAEFREFPDTKKREISAGSPCALVLDRPEIARRGEVLYRIGETPPVCSSRLIATIFWLGSGDFGSERSVTLKIGARRAEARLVDVRSVRRSETKGCSGKAVRLLPGEIAECELSLDRPVAFDPAERGDDCGRFVLVSDGRIRGGGLARPL